MYETISPSRHYCNSNDMVVDYSDLVAAEAGNQPKNQRNRYMHVHVCGCATMQVSYKNVTMCRLKVRIG